MSYGLIAYTGAGKVAFKFDTKFTAFRQKIEITMAVGTTTSISVPGITNDWLVCLSNPQDINVYNWLEHYITPGVLHLLAQSWFGGGTTTVNILLFETRTLQ